MLKSLIEKLYRNNGNTKVTLIAHSLGGLVSHYFLTGFNGIDQKWKDKHIHAYITLSAAWSGGVDSLESVVSGTFGLSQKFNHRIGRLASRYIQPLARSMESISWVLPIPSVFGNQILITTPSRNYTASDYKQLFKDIDYKYGYRHFQRVQALNANFPPPNVPMYCFYGNKKRSTPTRYIYSKDFSPQHKSIGAKATVEYSNGDGTVNEVSSLVCEGWSTMKPAYHFESKPFNGVGHTKIISDKKVLKQIASIVGAKKRKFFRRFWRNLTACR